MSTHRSQALDRFVLDPQVLLDLVHPEVLDLETQIARSVYQSIREHEFQVLAPMSVLRLLTRTLCRRSVRVTSRKQLLASIQSSGIIFVRANPLLVELGLEEGSKAQKRWARLSRETKEAIVLAVTLNLPFLTLRCLELPEIPNLTCVRPNIWGDLG